MTMPKTLAMRLLEGKKIPYEAALYPESERDAEAIADYLGVPRGQLFKTLVIPRAPGKPILIMTPGDRQLDLKKLARALGEKKLKMAAHQEAEALTGLQVGGISALVLLNKGFFILLDKSAQAYEEIYVSAGERGVNVKVPVQALIQLTGARLVDAVKE